MIKNNSPVINEVYSTVIENVKATIWYCKSGDKETYQMTLTKSLTVNDSFRSTQSFDARDISNLEKAILNCKDWLTKNPRN